MSAAADGSLPRRLRRMRTVALLGREVAVAEGHLGRLLGLALLPRARAGAGLLLPGCRSVHTFGMRFAIDVVFLDAGGRVLRRERAVPARRLVADRRARAVLELPTEGPTEGRR